MAVVFCLTASLRASVIAVDRSSEALRARCAAIRPENDGTAMTMRIDSTVSPTSSSGSVTPRQDGFPERGDRDVRRMVYFQQLDATPEAVLLPVFDRPSVPHAESLEAWLPVGTAFSV